MPRVIVTDLADADTAKMLADIASDAGYLVASKTNARIEDLYERLADYPESCQARLRLGAHIRVGVVFPYLVIYRHIKDDDTVSIIRIIHGRREITRKILRGDQADPCFTAMRVFACRQSRKGVSGEGQRRAPTARSCAARSASLRRATC